MKSLSEMSVGEVAAYVAEHLRQDGISVVLTGGSCVSIYTDNRYLSFDLDFIEEGQSTRKKIATCLQEIAFRKRTVTSSMPIPAFSWNFRPGRWPSATNQSVT